MKKSLKRTAAAVLAVATTAGVVGTTSLSNANNIGVSGNQKVVYADTATANRNTLEICRYEKTVKLYDEFVMPTAKFVDNTGASSNLTEYTVTTPTGATFTQENVTGGKFKVDEIGTYTISYAKGDYKGEVTLTVEASQYSISLEQNNANILPKKIAIKKFK